MRYDWRDTLRLAADLALLGILVTLASVPIVTAGAAFSAGSASLERLLTIGRWSTAAECWASFRTRLVPGALAGPLVLAAAWLVALDVIALRRGAVPGGTVMIAAVLLAAAAAAGFAALVAGLAAGPGAVRRARALVALRPSALVATTGVVLIAAALAALVHPALLPVLVGYALFAVHVVLLRKSSRMPSALESASREPASREPASPEPALPRGNPRSSV
ncbi:hypothetical protein [Actinoplanes solisilvae]|uniref:hypothetical protein n=1 Tax=Actinoplanes solisilvae TaxID=2486853 RepID=UPI000FDC707A|nr:hypothetical protein [Actinoplanes solisilvae]